MSDNNSNSSCGGSCLNLALFFVIISLVFTWCDRKDGKGFIDSSIEQVHHLYAHADSVWNNDTIKN